jgi:DNA-binding LytR/AlgR family response regulator
MANHRCGYCTVLIAEDEECLKLLATLTIKAKGLEVLAASNAEQALQFWETHAEEIVLLFTDIVMPGPMNGFDVAKRIRTKSPAMPVIFSSGHGGALPGDGTELQKNAIFLPKPYKQNELSALVSAVLAANALRAQCLG